jgi:hypothetical protein
MAEKKTKEPISKLKLAFIYPGFWLGAGLLAGLLHFTTRPDYISISTCILGSVANLFGPWARLLAVGWPNAGKLPHASLAVVSLFLLVTCVILILMSLNSRRRWIQIICIVTFVPAVICWIFLGFMELKACAI